MKKRGFINLDSILCLFLLISLYFGVRASQDMQQMENELTFSKKNLTYSKYELEFTKTSLSHWTNLCRQQENASQSKLEEKEKVIEDLSVQLIKEKEIFQLIEEKKLILESEYEKSLRMAEEEIEKEKKKGRPRKASYKEVMEFLERDQTDKKLWTEDYDCSLFTFDTMWNALEENIIACPVEIRFEDGGGHLLLGFPTSDLGLVFFEPQEDIRVRNSDLVAKKNYCKLVGWKCNWNDTISKIEIAKKCR